MKISVVIPVLNEADRFDDFLSQPALQDADVEVIVCDGGSRDDSQMIAFRRGVKVLTTEPGRGQQIAAGAAAARGDVVLFLHADTLLPANAMDQIRDALNDSRCLGGNFQLSFDGGSKFANWLTGFYAWLRSRGFYYGDSAIFIRRDVLEQVGGVRPISLMEDYDLVRRMEKLGETVCVSEPGATTSSRRFAGRKPWRIFWQWCYIHALFHLGVSTDWLARAYRSDSHAG